MTPSWKLAGVIAGGLALSVTSGCESTPELFTPDTADSLEEAGNVFVSVYPSVPWSEIGAKLEPKHNLTAEAARTLVVRTSQIQVDQFLSTFAAALSVGLPTRTFTETTSLDAAGKETTTATRTRGSGAVPASSGIPSTTIGTADLGPNLTQGAFAGEVDGGTLLTAATALYQQAQILDHQIGAQYLPPGFTAHLVTFQVNLQPAKRKLPYDTYVNITLLPGSLFDGVASAVHVNSDPSALPPVTIYPLIITDALETASVGRSIETVRQAALQLAGVVGNVGVNAGVSGGSDRLRSIVALDKNSLVTVGRVSDHTIRVRLGAQYDGSGGLVMVPRTYNISAMVLINEAIASWQHGEGAPDTHRAALTAITHSGFAPATDGAPKLSSRRDRNIAEEVSRALRAHDYPDVALECAAPLPTNSRTTTPPERRGNYTLLRALDRGDYVHVARCLNETRLLDATEPRDLVKEAKRDRSGDTLSEVRLRRVLARLMEIQTESRYSKLLIPVKRRSKPVPPVLPGNQQLVFVADDGKASASAVIRGAQGLTPGNVKAVIALTGGKEVVPTATKVSDTGTEVEFTFPSFMAHSLSGELVKDLPLVVRLSGSECEPNCVGRFAIRSARKEPPQVANPVSAAQSVLVADSAGTARVTLQVGSWKGGGALTLAVAGADVREDKTIGAPPASPKGISIKPDSIVTLLLGNLTPARSVQVTTRANGDAVGTPLVFTVDRAGARAAQ